jgi:hypothetical protein
MTSNADTAACRREHDVSCAGVKQRGVRGVERGRSQINFEGSDFTIKILMTNLSRQMLSVWQNYIEIDYMYTSLYSVHE